MEAYDVIVVGGGIAGALASVAAAEGGAQVLLLEEEGYLGGSLTACGTGPMMTFHAGEGQVIQGLAQRLIARLVERGLSPGHIPDTTGYTYTVTPFDAEGMKRELELMAQEAGVQVLYHSSVIAANRQDARITGITVASCGTCFEASAACYIDASGDGDLLALAKVPFVQGRQGDGKDQPMTLNLRLDHVDIKAIRQLMRTDISLFPLLANGKETLPEQASRLSISGFQAAMQKARADGELSFDRDIVLCFETNTRNEVIVNMTRVNGENPTDPWSISRAEREGRRQAWELISFLRRRIPGFANAHMLYTGPRIGVRSSRRLIGCYTLTAEDILSARHFDDGIAANGYPVDVHSPDGEETNSRHLAPGQYYTVPYRCLISDEVANLLVAGRNLSATFEAHASARVSPCCGALGHAAGCAAAMAAAEGLDVRALDTDALRAELFRQGAFL